MSDEQVTPEAFGLELTFAELMVLPLMRGQSEPSRFLELVGLEAAVDGSIEARAGLASLAVRGLVDLRGDEFAALPSLIVIADVIVDVEQVAVITLGRDGTMSNVHLLERAGIFIMHRRVAGGLHLFTPLDPDVGFVGLAKGFAEALSAEPSGAMSLGLAIVDGVPTDRELMLIDLADVSQRRATDQIRVALGDEQ